MATTAIFVRHTDKQGDEEGIYKGEMALPSERGMAQAKPLIRKLLRYSPGIILSSALPRSIWLAERVAAAAGLPFSKDSQHEIFNEMDKSQELVGLKYSDPRQKEVMQAARDNYPNVCGPDEQIVHRTFDLIESLPEEKGPPVIVGHAKRIASYAHSILNNGSLTDYYQQADRYMLFGTTGISIFKLLPGRRPPYELFWHIATLNDVSHALD